MAISTKLFTERQLDNFKSLSTQIEANQQKIATGDALKDASEDPVKAVKISALAELLGEVERYDGNIVVARERLTLSDTVIGNLQNVMIRLKELSIQAANDTLFQSDRDAIRHEVKSIRDLVLGLSNTLDSTNQPLFSGTSNEKQPFRLQKSGEVEYLGNNDRQSIQVSRTSRVPSSIPGGDLFLGADSHLGKLSVFEIMNSFVNALDTADQFIDNFEVSKEQSVDVSLATSAQPRQWSLKLEGIFGKKIVHFQTVNGSVEEAVEAINELKSVTAIKAKIDESGQKLVLSNDEADFSIAGLEIEGVTTATEEPKYFATFQKENAQPVKMAPIGQSLREQIGLITAIEDKINISRALVGSHIAYAEETQQHLDERKIVLNQQHSDLKNADLEKIVTELQNLLVTRDAARQAYTRINQSTLFDFLS